MSTVLRALDHRNFRLFFAGQSISLIGTWIQQIAMSWLVYRLTQSALLLGITGFVSQIPILLLAPFAGIWSDRLNLRRMLLATQLAAMVQAFALAWLTITHLVQVWHIITLAALLGVVSAFDTPVRQSFLVKLVGNKQDLPNAIALNSFMMNAGRLIGPSVAGLLVTLFDEATCFLINGVSYVAVIGAVLLMRIPARKTVGGKDTQSLLHGLKEGIAYAWHFAPIRMLLPLLALIAFMATPYMVLMPIFAAEVFRGNARTLGFLVGAAGLGALAGTVYLASRPNVRGLAKIIVYATAAAGVALMLFSLSTIYWISLLLLIATGFGIIVTAASINMIFQTIVEDDKRGRVMSFYTMGFLGVAPLGALAAGTLANHIGAGHTLFIGGACCLAGAFYLHRKLPVLRAEIKPVYQRLGIITE